MSTTPEVVGVNTFYRFHLHATTPNPTYNTQQDKNMSITNELRLERELKARSDAMNRVLLGHEEDIQELHDKVEFYRRVVANLMALIILLGIFGGYAYYLKGTTPVPIVCEQEKSKPSKKGKESYVIEEYTLTK